ncbi:MAG: alanine--glyoxylate aminotransferase family protein [Anaerolineae bacterium]|nr:alanine--glyoxylate aminotransferase family protein [Anaerolineae bacterium]
MPQKLMIPGPVDIDDEVLAEMRTPSLPHYGASWVRTYTEVIQGLKRLFHTANDLFLLVGPGSAALEAAIGSAVGPDDRILIPSNGFFGGRLREVAKALRLDVVPLDVPWGQPLAPDAIRKAVQEDGRIRAVALVHHETSTGVLNPLQEIAEVVKGQGRLLILDAVSSLAGMPVPVDEWGVDLCVTVSNKCLEAPPGLAPISVSEDAWRAIDANAAHSRSWFLNLATWRRYLQEWGSWHPTPTTVPTQVIMALRKSVQRLLAEGDEARFARHRAAAEAVRQGIRELGLETFIPDDIASPLVTVIAGREDARADALRRYLQVKHDIIVSGGLGDLAGRIVRVGHMGRASSQEYVEAFLRGVREWVQAGCP